MHPNDEKKLLDKVDNIDTKDPGQSDESLGSDLSNIKDNCEDIFNIEKDNQEEEDNNENQENQNYVNSRDVKIRIKNPSKPTSENSSLGLSDLKDEKVIKKTAFDYLMEEAEKENERLKRKIYENNSFSSDNVNVKKLKEIRRKQRNIKKFDIDINSYAGEINYKIKPASKKREYKKKKTRKEVVIVDPLSAEGENIESFADFSDSMFSTKIRDNMKVFVCANKDCLVELPSLSRIKRHYLVHTNIKPFKCLSPKCNKRFSRKDNMLQHYRTHCKNKKSKD